MYHSWGSQNPWLRQIHGENPLYVPRPGLGGARLRGGRLGRRRLAARPHHRAGRAAWRRRTRATVWTWNAIGKRPGAWALDPAAPEATRGFLLNHLIPDRLPGGPRSNSDPVTGQAAWYDLRVRLERVPARTRAAPAFPAQISPVGRGPEIVAFGEGQLRQRD